MYSMPFVLQSSTSVALIGREASWKSVSPAQNFLKPPPVPLTPTVTRTSGATLRYPSATASLMRNTVLDPSPATVRTSPLLHPPATSASAIHHRFIATSPRDPGGPSHLEMALE